MAMNLGFGSNLNGLGSSTVGPMSTATASQLQQLLAQIQSQQQAGQQPTQLAQMQQLTGPAAGASPGGGSLGLAPNSAGAMQGGGSAFPGNPGSMSPAQMLQQPQQGMPNMGGASWPGMNGANNDPTSTSIPGDGSQMAQLSGTTNPNLISSGLGLMAALAGNGSKNKAAAQTQAPSAQSRLLQSGQNGALQRLLSGYGASQLSGLMGAYGG